MRISSGWASGRCWAASRVALCTRSRISAARSHNRAPVGVRVYAGVLAEALSGLGPPLFTTTHGPTRSHQFAIDAQRWGGGHAAAMRLREANILTCAIGLPDRSPMAGLRIGTPEVVRWGMTRQDRPRRGCHQIQEESRQCGHRKHTP
jgi:glycine/serine hydroxymethyltransferase